jgi:rhodanese-related sulfurtransferase
MNTSLKLMFTFGMLFISSFSLTDKSLAGDRAMKETLQDTKKAVEFFENELSFKTNPHGVKAVLEGKVKNVTIVDVRSAKDFAKGHIPGAVNIPWEHHKSFEGDETEFPQLRKDGHNYVYCYTLLCNLAQKAAIKFASLGYPVKEIVGGFEEWEKHKLPIQK